MKAAKTAEEHTPESSLATVSSLRRPARDTEGDTDTPAAAAAAAAEAQTYFIPCEDAARAREVYRELLEIKRGSKTVVRLGTKSTR